MNTRKLGSEGFEVSAIGLGCMGMSYSYGPPKEAEGLATIARALEVGVTLFDTAEIYGPYTNEELVGRALSGHRDQVQIATKFGFNLDPEYAGTRGVDGRPENARRVCDASLRRLGTDYIDLYYQHRVDPDVPVEETVGAMGELVQQGKVRFIGLSEAGPETIRRAHATHPLTAVQSEYSLWTRDPEDGVLATLRELGIGFVAYSPLGRGFLTGKIRSLDDLAEDDWRRHNPRFQEDALQRNLALVDRVHELASARDVTSAQLAIAWVMAKGDDVVPIPGTTNSARIEEDAAAAELTLTPDELAELDGVLDLTAVHGARYPESGMAQLDS